MKNRIERLREEIARSGLHGVLVPRADAHQGEYVAPDSERLAWVTGFTGSAGLAVVLVDRAALFVDGRYTLQAADEVDTGVIDVLHSAETKSTDWIADTLPQGARLGFDPWLHTPGEVARLEAACAKAGARLEALEENPVDIIWIERPGPPTAPVHPHPPELAGRTAVEKRHEVADALSKEKLDAAVVSDPAALAWLFNLRGGDIPHTPVALGFAIIDKDARASLFLEDAKLTPEARAGLGDTQLLPPDAFGPALDALGAANLCVRLDQATGATWILRRLQTAGAKPKTGLDPCALPKARKNETELDGIRAAHARDGAALTRFLAWIKTEAPKGGITELSAVEKLEALRAEAPEFRDTSFDTISGAGSNGAIVHYRVSRESDRPLESGILYLVDSGGQYPDGTTDVTRTVAVGEPTEEMRARFTRVLKGHIAIASAKFPKGTAGSQLDALARQALWEAGLDYDHGTGHGVGCFLGVHEGPQRISKLPSTVALEPGMVLSNEPGYYKPGAYGIRIENLLAVIALEKEPEWEREMMAFETLTLAPIDRDLIDPALLTAGETAWLNAYHARVHAALRPRLDVSTLAWLEEAAAPLG